MLDKDKVIYTLQSKITHAKDIDRDFVYLPVWQARDVMNYLKPLKPRKTISGFVCDNCGHQLVNNGYYQQKHCDECGQPVDWQKVEGTK